MSDKVPLKVQVEKELRDRVESAAKMQGMTMVAWVTKTLLASLPPVAGPVVPSAMAVAMDQAFDKLDEDSGLNDYPGVLPIPPMPWAVQQAQQAAGPMAEQVQPPQSIHAQQTSTSAAPYEGHSCAHLVPGGAAGYTANQINGTCSAQGGRVCHWASHVAKQCPVFRPRRVHVAPMAPLR